MMPVPGFTRKAIDDRAKDCLSPGSVVASDGLACFAGVTDADFQHQPVVVGGRKPRRLLAASTGPRPRPWLRLAEESS